jgi:fucose 4-O-acetylase-like acetyltransferase
MSTTTLTAQPKQEAVANTVSPYLSSKFKFWAFVSMVLLVFVHGYNINPRYLQPWTLPDDPLTITAFTEYFLANGLFRFRIPMLFMISGFLYALHDHKTYASRTNKRIKTLLVPYLAWSAISLITVFLFESFSSTRKMVELTRLMQIDESRIFLSEYKWYEVVGRWLFFPVAFQLWFIRVLLIYNIAYPAIRFLVSNKIATPIFFVVASFLFLTTFGFVFIEGEGLLFFALGVWMQKKNFNIEVPSRWLRPLPWTIVFISLSIIKTWLAFNGFNYLQEGVYHLLALLHKLVVISGLITAWFGLDPLVKWFMNRKWFAWASAFSFIIYALHAPLITFLIDPVFALLNFSPGYRMITFIILPLSLVALSIGLGALLRNYVPGLYGWLTGGRGFLSKPK